LDVHLVYGEEDASTCVFNLYFIHSIIVRIPVYRLCDFVDGIYSEHYKLTTHSNLYAPYRLMGTAVQLTAIGRVRSDRPPSIVFGQ
jgi:hypothetical protein